jgi:predicted TIM-barrel fold metal-dependent hydrolase
MNVMENQNTRRSFLRYLFSLSAFIAGSSLSFNKKPGVGNIGMKKAWGKDSGSGKKFKKIAVEEHCYTDKYLDWLYSSRVDMTPGRPRDDEAVLRGLDRGEGRIREMDEAGVDMQILSLSYPDLDFFKAEDAVSLSRIVNDELAETVKRYPDRFRAYCCLPFQDPEAAAEELERAVTKLGLVGAMVNENTKRTYADSKFEVVYERLNKLKVPIYLHQTESGQHLIPDLINLINGDFLDKYPDLTFILGHGGEAMPFWLWRRARSKSVDGKRSFKQKFIEHFYVTTSDQCWPTLLKFLIEALGSDRIMFAADYPYESSKQHVDFIDSAPISETDREKISCLNAKKLFRL